tara:strand:- start:93 stop:518 length:426 start_codon:yes stop_codon:yes gene_type:complete
MSIQLSNHGGGCCGINHLSGFKTLTRVYESRLGYRFIPISTEDIISNIEGAMSNVLEEELENSYDEEYEDYLERKDTLIDELAFECIITDWQFRQGGGDNLLEALNKMDFKLVARWTNPNTNNHCNMFIKNIDKDLKGFPF